MQTPGLEKSYYHEPAKNTFKSRYQEVNNYDRFILLGVEGTTHVLLILTHTPKESRKILCYRQHLAPACFVWVLSSYSIGYRKTTQNPFIPIVDPLLLEKETCNNLPTDINIPNCVFFDFLPKTVESFKLCLQPMCEVEYYAMLREKTRVHA